MSNRNINNYQYVPLDLLPGTSPLEENTALSTLHYIDAKRIRFYRGKPQKLGGWKRFNIDDQEILNGVCRNVYYQNINGNPYTLFGTNSRLYSLRGTELTNITPIDSAIIAIPDSLDSNFTTLANDPINTVASSMTVTVSSVGHMLELGDRVQISGVVGPVNGIPAGDLNAVHLVRAITVNSYDIIVSTAATSTGVGGGAAVTEETNIITVNRIAHGLSDGDRIKIDNAVAFAGILAPEINKEHIIRNVTTNTFDFLVSSFANASLTGQGGPATTMQDPLPAGLVDASFGQGYGLGRYGVGRYGVSKTGTAVRKLPRVWSFDRFGNNVVLTPGNQGGVYEWGGDTSTAPAILSNAPAAVNYVFVSNNIVVVLGADGVENRIQWSDIGQSNDWTPLSTNFAGQDDIEGANRFISHVNVRGTDLLWTDSQMYTMRFINRPLVWEFKKVEDVEGIIGQNARITYNGVAYWMGRQDFFLYSGGVVKRIPSNNPDGINYLRQFVFGDINSSQSPKSFAWFNKKYSEIWFHYPCCLRNEPDMIARWSINEGHWTKDVDFDRTAAEYPNSQDNFPKLTSLGGIVYRHEDGLDDDTNPMEFSLTSKYFELESGTNEAEIGGIIPDSLQIDNINFTIDLYPYPQSINAQSFSSTISPTTEKLDFLETGRMWNYTISQSVLGGNWRMGSWNQRIQMGSPR